MYGHHTMLHCSIPVMKTNRLNTVATTATTSPGAFTAKRLQTVLNVPLLTSRQQESGEEKPSDEFVSPYGRLPRTSRKARHRHRPDEPVIPRRNDAVSRVRHDLVAKRKHCRKLDPMTAQVNPKHPQGNQASSSGAVEVAPDEKRAQKLRIDLIQTNADQLKNTDSLKSELQWIHGHFPVLKLANAKCSRSLRQQLFRNAIVHVFITVMLRKAWSFWRGEVIDAQRKERFQLSASRQLIVMFERVSLNLSKTKFDRWRGWVLKCQAQEHLAAAITLQQFARYIRSRREGKVITAKQAILMQALQDMSRQVEKIQNAYRQYRRTNEQQHREDAATIIQRIAMTRIAQYGFAMRQRAAIVLQRNYRARLKRCCCKRAAGIANLLKRSHDRQAHRIQSTWLAYKLWRDCVLPRNVIEALVDQVESQCAVLSIQSHLRGFQSRFRLKKQTNSAVCIQKCWRSTLRRKAVRVERQMLHLSRNLAASCVQRTLRRRREDHNNRVVMHRSTRPLYLRARHLGHSFNEQYQVQITKSASSVIQTTWRRHRVYEKEKLKRLTAVSTLQRFWKHNAILSKWHSSVFGGQQQHYRQRLAAARTLQRWVRGRRFGRKNFATAESVVEQISAVFSIQRWYRRRLHDHWGAILARLLDEELPKCIDAANRLVRCWRRYSARKLERLTQTSKLAELIEQQHRQQVEGHAACCIQRMIRRAIDKRDGKLLLQQYKILVRVDLKRRQQRMVVHKYLEEKTHQRKKKQEAHTPVVAACRGSTKRETPSQPGSSDSDTIESVTSAPHETSQYSGDANWQQQDAQGPVQYWSEEYQRAYLFDPASGVSTWL